SQFELYVPNDQVQSRNVAAVMVIAKLPAFAAPGDRVDVTVTSIGDARSLLGGTLLLTPLKGADAVVHALAQGALSVGGYKYDLNGNVVNERTGTVVSGGDVRISKVVVSHGELKVSITTDYLVSQPGFVSFTGPGVRTAIVPRTRIEVQESEPEGGSVVEASNTVADLV